MLSSAGSCGIWLLVSLTSLCAAADVLVIFDCSGYGLDERIEMPVLMPAEFTNALCQEKWFMEGGKLQVTGQSESAGNVKLEWKPEEETTDAFGEHPLPHLAVLLLSATPLCCRGCEHYARGDLGAVRAAFCCAQHPAQAQM